MSVSILTIRALAEAVELAGVSGEDLLRAAGIERERVRDRTNRVSLAEFERLQVVAIELTGDEAFGLRMAESASFVGFDVLASLLAHATTLRDSINA
ncbi:MAG TPA: AraC family transcriptional regulator ligand-binding domain-containing protein, partial [Polyangiaceae bacterium]|nr:AraC family transcriptional regulator ligand-binding domain-containing protein [Polyangiaceae bacterium]